MAIGRELCVTRQRFQRVRLPGGVIAFDPINHLRVENKEAAVDKGVIAWWLLDERFDYRALEFERAIAPGRPDRGDGSKLAVAAMKGDRGGDVDVRKPVAIGEAERLIRIQIVAHALEPAAGQRGFSGIDQRDDPWLGMALMIGDAVSCR